MHYSIRFEASPPSLCKVCKTSIFTEQREKYESSKKLNDFQSYLSCKWKTQYQNLQTPQKVFFSSIKAFKNILSSLLYKIEGSQNILKFSWWIKNLWTTDKLNYTAILLFSALWSMKDCFPQHCIIPECCAVLIGEL